MVYQNLKCGFLALCVTEHRCS